LQESSINPSIENLRKLRVGHIVSFNARPERYKLVEVKPNDEFVFEQLTEREAKVELAMLLKVNQALSRRWVKRG
jgi:hypothetical protein